MLQLDWSISRLRPNSVSIGRTETQFDLHAAIAAAFADQRVDEDALVGIGDLAALAAPALFGRAGLVVDQHRDARIVAQLASAPRRARRGDGWSTPGGKSVPVGVFLAARRPRRRSLHAFGGELAGDLRHGQVAVDRLAAGHGDRVVEQHLVGDVDLGRDGGADRERAGVVIGAVAEILEDVLRSVNGACADPGRALAAHLA